MSKLLAEIGFFAGAPMWLAAVLLLGGGGLLAWPVLRRRFERSRHERMSRRVPTLDERLNAVLAAARHRDELERLIFEARETIRAGCEQLDARLERLERLGPAEPAERTTPEVRVRSVQPATGEPTRGLDDPMTREVYALADAGKSTLEIARHLGEHLGKIELMLALRRV